MSMYPSPAGGLLQGLMSGQQARLQREQAELQQQQVMQQQIAQRQQQELQWMQFTDEMRSAELNLTPDNYDFFRQRRAEASRIARQYNLNFPADMEPEALQRAGEKTRFNLNPAEAGAQKIPSYAQKGYGSIGAKIGHLREQEALRWEKEWAATGGRWASELTEGAVASKDMGLFIATAYADGVSRYGAARAHEAMSTVLPLLEGSARMRELQAAAFAQGAQDHEKWVESTEKETLRRLQIMITGQEGPLQALEHMLTSKQREDLAFVFKLAPEIVRKMNVFGAEKPFTATDAVSYIMKTYGVNLGLLDPGRSWTPEPSPLNPMAHSQQVVDVLAIDRPDRFGAGSRVTVGMEDNTLSVTDNLGYAWQIHVPTFLEQMRPPEVPEDIKKGLPPPPAAKKGLPPPPAAKKAPKPKTQQARLFHDSKAGPNRRERLKRFFEAETERQKAKYHEGQAQRSPHRGLSIYNSPGQSGHSTIEWTGPEKKAYWQGMGFFSGQRRSAQ